MFKFVAFFAILAVAFAAPEPKPKPGIIAYSSPLVSAPVAYSAGYISPYAYAAPYAYSAYSAYPAYSAYSSYTAPLVVG